MKNNYKNAFTLAELLTVISIITVLLAILTPAVTLVRARAKSLVCRANLKSCATGFVMYLDDYDMIMPPAAQMPSTDIYHRPGIGQFLAGYISGEKTLKCPGDSGGVFFSREKSSYEYNALLGGKPVEKSFLAGRFGSKEVHLLRDYQWFHGKKGSDNAYNYLYADGLVAGRER